MSSWIEEFFYDSASETLTLNTNSGDTYDYSSVPSETASEMANAVSKGAFHNAEIRGHYDCVKR
jgi:hypothetical protein|tara:strand:- start:141 stop:332 length:192 start_codon:yes stop_codon:yes gene_type:complete